jgi:hypothetical protein
MNTTDKKDDCINKWRKIKKIATDVIMIVRICSKCFSRD